MDENFIPYSMIEPLLTPGMTGVEMTDAILRQLGLSRERYQVTVDGPRSLPLSEILKNGIRVIVRGTADKTHTIGADSEPVL